jgi:hypothetical protein
VKNLILSLSGRSGSWRKNKFSGCRCFWSTDVKRFSDPRTSEIPVVLIRSGIGADEEDFFKWKHLPTFCAGPQVACRRGLLLKKRKWRAPVQTPNGIFWMCLESATAATPKKLPKTFFPDLIVRNCRMSFNPEQSLAETICCINSK